MTKLYDRPDVIEPVTEANSLTWETLSKARTKNLFVPKYNGYVTYKTFIPLDEMAKIQARWPGKRIQDIQGRMIDMLKYVMVSPPITEESVRAVAKADSGLLLEIIGDAVGTQEADEMRNSLGDGLGED